KCDGDPMASFPLKSPLAPRRSAGVRNHLFHLVRSMGPRAGVAAALLICGAPPPARAADTVDDVQKTVAEWVRVRAETARIEDDWTWQQMLMQSTLEALQERTQQLDAQRTELED